MVHMHDLHPELRRFLEDWEVPAIPGSPWVQPPPKGERRLALVSSAGLRRKGDRAFDAEANDYRVIPQEAAGDLVMDHLSTSHDRSGFQEDVNTVFPLERLAELVEEGDLGALAAHHYSFMGATDPRAMEASARDLAGIMKREGVNCVLLAPV